LQTVFAPGLRVVVRDAEWVIRRVDRTPTGGQALTVDGVSQLVRDHEALFLTEIEKRIDILDPADTRLTPDSSSGYRDALLYMESQLRRAVPTDDQLHIGHRAAMDPVPYQLEPARLALAQPRQRILIADAVGLGKTLEAGILISELIRRGRGKRILAVAVKSMLTQFQKELWSRFAIPLTRLDSAGVKRVREQIPTNHNPFLYYDKAIVSMDTLKQAEYRVYLEQAYWDIIVIDEAHNVAQRGGRFSQRAKLAKLFAKRSDTLIMLSATPHDGKAESFASLMNILDPTAIADPADYGPEEIKGLFIRRFKKDIRGQTANAFKPRVIRQIDCEAGPSEERAFEVLAETRFSRLDRAARAGELFKTTLEKALLSSPAACLQTCERRLARLAKLHDAAYADDIAALRELAAACRAVKPEGYAKLRRLVALIREDFAWTGDDPEDRLVVFTERIETLRFLAERLPRELDLPKGAVDTLHGGMSDIDQQRVVEAFGQKARPLRLLIASDVASEGINLHYLCRRLIHFDIPWSLMVFQQRNGRIDRYGQTRTPRIAYLVVRAKIPKIRDDVRILEILIRKDEQAHANIGDPRALMGIYDQNEEEKRTARAIEEDLSAEQFDASLAAEPDPLELLLQTAQAAPPARERERPVASDAPSLFAGDYRFLEAALRRLSPNDELQLDCDPRAERIEFQAPEDLRGRFRFLPREIQPEHWRFALSAQAAAIQEEIVRSRVDEHAWPRLSFLWDLHPVVEWALDKLAALFGRHEAPVLTLGHGLSRGEDVVVLSAMTPNRKGHPLIHRWFAALFIDGAFLSLQPFAKLLERVDLRRDHPNPNQPVAVEPLQALLPRAIEEARREMAEIRHRFEAEDKLKLDFQRERLKDLKIKQERQLRLRFQGQDQPEAIRAARREREQRAIDETFAEFERWIEDTRQTEDQPYIQVIAVLRGADR